MASDINRGTPEVDPRTLEMRRFAFDAALMLAPDCACAAYVEAAQRLCDEFLAEHWYGPQRDGAKDALLHACTRAKRVGEAIPMARAVFAFFAAPGDR